jgi:AcrR family transcriptional regulator
VQVHKEVKIPYNEGMPKLRQATRDGRRLQILDAARACVDEHGLEAVSMEMIIAASGLSVGTVYRYFAGKDDIISAAVLGGTAGLAEALEPLLTQEDPPPPGEFIGLVLRAIVSYGSRGPVDLTRVALHGWSHSRTDAGLRAAVESVQCRARDQLAQTCRRWQAAGIVGADVDPDAVAELLLSVILGFIAQRSLAGGASIEAHVAAVTALVGAPAR